jgi:hypothetical protein
MPLEPAVRRKPTLLSPATIVGGVGSNSRSERPHENMVDLAPNLELLRKAESRPWQSQYY